MFFEVPVDTHAHSTYMPHTTYLLHALKTMPLDPKDVDAFIDFTRKKSAATERPKSKLEPYRDAILGAVAQGLPVSAIREVLAEQCALKITYQSLREWIKRQPEARKGKGGVKKPMTKEQKEYFERLAKRDPNEPLTLG